MAFHEVFKNYCTGPFGFPMPEDEARVLDKELETDNEVGLLRVTKGYDKSNYFIDGERADVSTITDDSLDEDGEIVELKSLNFESFRKNPVVTFNHNYLEPPIGKSLWQKQVNESWKAKTIYAPRPADLNKELPWFPDQIFGLVKSGFLPGKSIGGIAKFRKPTAEEVTKYGPNLKTVRYNAKIYEYSVVTRQANNNAMVEAVSKGLITIPDKLLSEFPEIAKALKDSSSPESRPVIKSFKTVEQFNKENQGEFERELQKLYEKAPQMIDDCFARMLGKV